MSEASPKREYHYCNVTFLREGSPGAQGEQDGEGELVKLKACARCHSTFYVSREAQKAHWKIHKKVCQPPDNFLDLKQRILSSSATEAVEILVDVLDSQTHDSNVPGSPHAGYTYLWVLQRLEQLAREGDSTSYAIAPLCSFGYGFWTNEQVERFWAVPGMTTFLMNLDLVSEAVSKRKVEHEHLGHPPYKMLTDEGYQQEFELGSCFCNYIGCVLTGTAILRKNSRANSNPFPRCAFPAAVAATRKVLGWLSDFWTFVSLPRCGGSGAHNMYVDVFYHYMHVRQPDPHDPTMIAPGLTYEGAMRVMLHYLVAGGFPYPSVVEDLLDLLIKNARFSTRAWKAFSVARRARLVVEINSQFLGEEKELNLQPHLEKYCGDIQQIAAGWTFHPESLWMNVVKEGQKVFGDEANFLHEWLDKVLNESSRPAAKEFLVLAGVSVPTEVEALICEFSLQCYPENIYGPVDRPEPTMFVGCLLGNRMVPE